MVREDKAERKDSVPPEHKNGKGAPVRRGRSEGPGESRDAAGAADERFAEGRTSAEGGSAPPEQVKSIGALRAGGSLCTEWAAFPPLFLNFLPKSR